MSAAGIGRDPRRPSGPPGSAGCGQGHAVRSVVAPLRHPAHLHRRHAPLGRQGGHGVRPEGQGDHGPRRARVRRHHGRRRRRAAPQRRHPQPRLHPRRLPPHGRPGRAARQDHRAPAPRPRGRPGRARRGRAQAAGRPPGLHRLRDELLASTARPATAGCATTAAATWCSAPTTPPRRSRSASTSTSARPPRSSPGTRTAACCRVDGHGSADEVTARLVAAIDEARRP